MHIKIGDIKTLTVKNWAITPDDRQTKIETIGGVIVQDFGHVEEGDTITCEVTIFNNDANILYGYWHNRTLVNVEDEAGAVLENMRVKVRRYRYLEGFKKYYWAKLELWRV